MARRQSPRNSRPDAVRLGSHVLALCWQPLPGSVRAAAVRLQHRWQLMRSPRACSLPVNSRRRPRRSLSRLSSEVALPGRPPQCFRAARSSIVSPAAVPGWLVRSGHPLRRTRTPRLLLYLMALVSSSLRSHWVYAATLHALGRRKGRREVRWPKPQMGYVGGSQ
jgi:hypothetical protein